MLCWHLIAAHRQVYDGLRLPCIRTITSTIFMDGVPTGRLTSNNEQSSVLLLSIDRYFYYKKYKVMMMVVGEERGDDDTHI